MSPASSLTRTSGSAAYERPKIACVVPCHNEEATIAGVVRDLRSALPEADIYVYDNASTGAFIHALNLSNGLAWCIDLPGPKSDRAAQRQWGLAAAPDGSGGRLWHVVQGTGGHCRRRLGLWTSLRAAAR